LSGAASFFLPALVSELNGEFELPGGKRIHRLASQAFNLEDTYQLSAFLKGSNQEIKVPRVSGAAPKEPRTVNYDPLQRIGVGLSCLSTGKAVALGAFDFALQQLDQEGATKKR
jgi:glucokinase